MYKNEFYESRDSDTRYAAETILSVAQEVMPEVESAVDLGCGVGTWLSVLKDRGVTKVLGMDGKWVDKSLLVIDEAEFVDDDLAGEPRPETRTRYDLAISLEVAEHLPPTAAAGFVSLLADLSDFVLFSAAVPGQGGVGHVNEQWPDYWISLFAGHGYSCLDVIRKRIWDDESIPLWYRQNILLFVRDERVNELELGCSPEDHIPPETYLHLFRRATADRGIKQSLRDLVRAVGRRARRALPGGP